MNIDKSRWQRVRFGDVVRLNTDRCADPATARIERYIGLEHIDTDSLRICRWGLVEDGTTFTNLFRPGQVLFVKRRAYQRKVAKADFDGVCSSDIYVFEPKDDRLQPELLPFLCQTEAFYEYAIGTSAGSLSPRTNWDQLTGYEFLLPPDEEQKKIAKLLVNIEQSVEALTGLELALERLRKAYILETFSRLDDDSAIPKVKASQAGEVLMGRQRAPQYDRGLAPRPYLRVANVYDGYIDISDVKEMDFTDDEFEQYKLYPGDVLLNEGQSRELVGRSSVFKGEIADCCFQNTLIRFRPQRVSSQYAQHYFQYCLYSGKFIAISKQTTSIAHLGVSRFAEISFPIAQPEQESRIVTSLSRIEMKLRATIERKEQLKQVKRTVLESETLT